MALFTKPSTQASQIRFAHAQEIAATCPDSLFSEIALTGSSARGLANENSDIEINLWLAEMPPLEDRQNWILSLAVDNLIAHATPRSDGSLWVNATYKGIELEIGWQTFADLEASLNELIEARTTENKKLRLAELVLSAKSLRGSGTLKHWQPILQNYPAALADKLIADALSAWLNEENWLESRLQSNDFSADIARIYRILFALNHRWEINWKWANHILPELKIAPKNLTNSVGERYISPENSHILKSPLRLQGDLGEGLELILNTLALVDPSFPNRNRTLATFQHYQEDIRSKHT